MRFFLWQKVCNRMSEEESFVILQVEESKEEMKVATAAAAAAAAAVLVSRTGRDLQRYNFLGHRQVVGCIPYRYKSSHSSLSSTAAEEDIEVLVISSQRPGKGMLFPKGGWETDESIETAALRETVEEAGVVGEVGEELGDWHFKSRTDETHYEGHMFPLLVREELEMWPEKGCRERRWVSVSEARDVCQYWWMKEALELLMRRVTK